MLSHGYCAEKNLFRLDSNAGFSFYADKEDPYSRKFLEILELCSKNITETIGKKSNDKVSKFFLFEDKSNKPLNASKLSFSYEELKKLDDISLIFIINEGLLQAHFQNENIPSWLNASIIHNALHLKNDFLHLQNRYVFTRFLMSKELSYKLNFIDNIKKLDTAPYLVKLAYLEKSKVLSRIIFRNKQFKKQLFEQISKGTYNHRFIYNVLEELAAKKNIAFELWLQEEVQRIVFNYMYPVDSGTILKQLDELSNLTVSRKNSLGQFELIQLPLEDLGSYKGISNKHFLSSIVFNYAKIYNKSPFYLKPQLLIIQEALVDYTKGKKKSYKKDILKAKTKIQSTYELEKRRQQWFEKVEREHYKSAKIYPELLNQHDDYNKALEQLFPDAYIWYKNIEQQIK
ncbi:hypothetical protein LNTAR_18243 [Lentisphaera araneosa HTCC2155]|uniref:Uncharacterized protein n=2 Tax=Lentisphaera TaxID=256846 RepID=A6DFY7_9BACT|nr:hypothetical protein LNTAR_18243 [Lentisphaera araneosa HTCC2155]